MLVALVQFRLPDSVPPERFREMCWHAAPDFRTPEGLIRKYFVLGEDGRTGGGVYLWRSRTAADQFYETGFRAMIAARFGSEPTITYFRAPVVVDNSAGRIESE
jgi:hypothetical protein